MSFQTIVVFVYACGHYLRSFHYHLVSSAYIYTLFTYIKGQTISMVHPQQRKQSSVLNCELWLVLDVFIVLMMPTSTRGLVWVVVWSINTVPF